MQCRTISIGLTCLILAMLATGAWAAPKYKVLYTFTGGSDGGSPVAGVVLDKAGNLYGTTYDGGVAQCVNGCGVVFELTPSAGRGWKQSVLYSFGGGADGGKPYGGVIMDGSGAIYGTTAYAGTFEKGCDPYGCGVAFELTPNSGGWAETVLHSF